MAEIKRAVTIHFRNSVPPAPRRNMKLTAVVVIVALCGGRTFARRDNNRWVRPRREFGPYSNYHHQTPTPTRYTSVVSNGNRFSGFFGANSLVPPEDQHDQSALAPQHSHVQLLTQAASAPISYTSQHTLAASAPLAYATQHVQATLPQMYAMLTKQVPSLPSYAVGVQGLGAYSGSGVASEGIGGQLFSPTVDLKSYGIPESAHAALLSGKSVFLAPKGVAEVLRGSGFNGGNVVSSLGGSPSSPIGGYDTIKYSRDISERY